MTDDKRRQDDRLAEVRRQLTQAALAHVPFDGWTDLSWRAALADSGITPDLARAAAPRRCLDLAAEFHRMGDEEMAETAAGAGLASLRYSERVVKLLEIRLDIASREPEAVRRGVTLFSLPHHAAEGSKLVWGTADAVWRALGDSSEDFNWYSKRAILSGVWSSTLLYWLGDQSEGRANTRAFLARRIDDVMKFEKTKAQARENPLARILFAGPAAMLSRVKAPGRRERRPAGLPVGLPGRRR